MTAFSFDILLEGKYRQTLFSNINILPVRKRRLPEMSALTSQAAPVTECGCIQAIRVNLDCISEKSKNYYGIYGFGTYVAFNISNGILTSKTQNTKQKHSRRKKHGEQKSTEITKRFYID